MSTLLVLGATGLVGREVVRLALADPRVIRVVAPTRRPLELRDPKLDNPVIDFAALPTVSEVGWWSVDAVVCALGTTMKTAGSKEAFRKVDHDLVLAAAARAREAGATSFALCSSIGAKARSGNFYLRTKGEVEDALRTLGYPSLTIVRPAGLGGERQEKRTMESVGLGLVKALGPLIPKNYRVIPAERVAAGLLAGALGAKPGVEVIESGALWTP